MMPAKPLITVKEARKLLGNEAKRLTDKEVEQFIVEQSFVASIIVKNIKNNLTVPEST